MLSFAPAVVALACGFTPPVWNASQTGHDQRLLGINSADGPTLVALVRANMLTPREADDVQEAIDRLGAVDFAVRERAFAELAGAPPGTHALLLRFEHDPNLERRRRVRQLLHLGLGRWSHLQAEAAVRLLRQVPSRETVDVLLQYLPYADDPGVRRETIAALADFARLDPAHARAIENHPNATAAAKTILVKDEISPTLLALDRSREFFALVAQGHVDKLAGIARLPFSLGNGVILTSDGQRDEFFKQAVVNYRDANRNAALSFLHVTRLEEHIRLADEPERSFLEDFPEGEVRVVHVRIRRDWQNEETGALLVHVGGSDSSIIGLGNTGIRGVRGR